jgi:hypothetical protein
VTKANVLKNILHGPKQGGNNKEKAPMLAYPME